MSKELAIAEGLLSERKVREIDKPEKFVSPCQGKVNLDYKAFFVWFDEFHDDVPVTGFAVAIKDKDLGSAGMVVPERKNVKRAALEITDSLCVTAGCNNGANCLKRRLKA